MSEDPPGPAGPTPSDDETRWDQVSPGSSRTEGDEGTRWEESPGSQAWPVEPSWPEGSQDTSEGSCPDLDLTYMSSADTPQAVDPKATQWSEAEGHSQPHQPLRSEQVLGPYQLREVLGQGGMGTVYRAWEEQAQREVALKVMRGHASERARERFLREGQLAARLQHPGIVDVHAVGEHEGQPYLACELVPQTLSFGEELRTAELERNLVHLRDAALALGHAHAAGLVHRDVKPDNLLLNVDGRVQVADFGLVHADDLDPLTRSGTFLGTPAYAPPEQGDPARLGPPCDVWALGVILYEAMVGVRPFAGATRLALRLQVASEEPTPPRALKPELPEALERICLKALRKEPAQRYADGAAFAADLQRYLAGERVLAERRQRRRVWLLVPILVLCLGLLAAAGSPWGGEEGAPEALASGRPVLELEPVPPLVGAESLTIRGSLAGESRCRVKVTGLEERGIPPGRSFSFRLPLRLGRNEIEVSARDREGRLAEPLRYTVTRVPRWYAARSPAERVELAKLPAGMRLGAGANEYVLERQGLSFTLVWVPAASFRFGPGVKAPRMTLTRGFWIGKHEVTWGQLKAFLATKPKVGKVGPQTHRYKIVERGFEEDTLLLEKPLPAPDGTPAFSITWFCAQRFCAWAGLRLPSEAEWELAAQGPGEQRFPWGNQTLKAGSFNSRNADPYPYTSPAGSFPEDRSPYGCLDMAGNLQEWVADRWAKLPAGPLRDYRGPEANPEDPKARVLRGGSWRLRYQRSFEATYRSRHEEDDGYIDVGFRVCLGGP